MSLILQKYDNMVIFPISIELRTPFSGERIALNFNPEKLKNNRENRVTGRLLLQRRFFGTIFPL
jgi:hypothetical protein